LQEDLAFAELLLKHPRPTQKIVTLAAAIGATCAAGAANTATLVDKDNLASYTFAAHAAAEWCECAVRAEDRARRMTGALRSLEYARKNVDALAEALALRG
jgi:glycosyltransferase A (GT-A) superfamily protein (DUF2064 family)